MFKFPIAVQPAQNIQTATERATEQWLFEGITPAPPGHRTHGLTAFLASRGKVLGVRRHYGHTE